MTLTLDLTPTEQARVLAAARQKGLEPAAFVKQLLTENLPETADDGRPSETVVAQYEPDRSHFYFKATQEEFSAALDEIAQMNKNLPPLMNGANIAPSEMTVEENVRAMDAFADENRQWPVLPDEAFDRENLYDERF